MFSTSQQQTPANQASRGAAPSIISSDVVITGILQSDGDIQIDGKVDGNVRSANLVIGEKAEIRGEVEAESVVVRGRVEGSIRARRVALAEGCHVEGDVLHHSLEVEFGAHVQGSFRHMADPLAETLPAASDDEDEAETMAERRRTNSPMRAVEQEAAMDETEMRKAG